MKRLFYIVVAFVFFPLVNEAQQKLSLDELLSEALKNNNAIHAGQYDVEAQRMNKKASFDPGFLSANLMYGQYNSIYKDNNITVNQAFSSPSVYASQAKVATAFINSSEKKLNVTENDIKRKVKSVYYSLLYFQSYKKLLLYQDSLYSEFVRASSVRYKTGETGFLEKVTAESQSMQVKTMLLQAEADVFIQKSQLKTVLNTEEEIYLQEDTIYKLNYMLAKDTSVLASNPFLSYLNTQAGIANAYIKLERAKLLPNFNVGYSSQTLQGPEEVNGQNVFFNKYYRFQYVQAGIGIPLWVRPYYARISAAKLGQQVAQANINLYKRNLRGDLQSFEQEYLKFSKSLSYYESYALPQSQLIISTAFNSYKAGAIGYVEFVQALTRALTFKSDYLKAVHDYNQSIVNIQYLLGE